jgi:peptidoglycan/xylan/chitin deacetylase (PgdA/CDA1 family)
VRATFFVNAKNTKKGGLDGSFAVNGARRAYRDVLTREAMEGHVLGNHTVDHADLGVLSSAAIEAQLDDNEALVNDALRASGAPPTLLSWIRPPYSRPWEFVGEQSPDFAEATHKVGTALVARGLVAFFNLDSTDSVDGAIGEAYLRDPLAPPKADPGAPTWNAKVQRIEHAVLGDARVAAGGGLVIVFHDTHPTSKDALGPIIDGLRAAGYVFGTLEEYAAWRWARASADLTPGPRLFDPCVAERDRGCAAFGAGRAREVCGRFWLAFTSMGGANTLGAPMSVPTAAPAEIGAIAQDFAHATLEVLPRNARTCDVLRR